MKNLKLALTGVLLTALFSLSAVGQTGTKSSDSDKIFDAKLAKKLGADQYGMRSYVLVILKTGPNDSKITDKDERSKLFKGHFDNMGRLAKEGKLAFAGPLDGKPKRGLFILAVKSTKEAEELVKTDPTVKAGIFVYDLTKLYGSAALMKVNEIHGMIQKEKI
ncbi:MAG: hypothetical protein HKN25_12915 [Pyrinomonadaceae bacterium]|nr:hypothetical protein [Pyrinomonadaceae bacterium]